MKHRQQKTKAKKSDRVWTFVLLGVFLVGMAILVYPSFSNWWNSKTQTRVVANYDAVAAAMDETDYTAFFEAAAAYNESLATLGIQTALTSPELVDGDYWSLLDINGTGIMGYITIERINVQLPIYHGTSDSVLQIAAGHVEGTSLPIGGESTHAVISAHRGLPSAKLFTDIDKLEVGDIFTVTILDQVLTYKVDQISVVLPTEVSNLAIEEGMDYCTLMTCTPYGINTHRLLVRGVRTTNVEEALIYVTADAYQIEPILVAPVLAIPLLLVLLIGLLSGTGKGRKKDTLQEPEG